MNNKRFSFLKKNIIDFTNIISEDQSGNTIKSDVSYNNLDWGDCESIYNHLISYINLMIINLSKDNDKLCKYLKEIFYAIFTISQKTRSYYKTISFGDYSRKELNSSIDKNSSLNDMNKNTDNSNSLHMNWTFITGAKENEKVNNKIQEKEKELNNTEFIFHKKQMFTPRIEKSKILKDFEISIQEEKFERLQKKLKNKEKQFNIHKLQYLLKINEQNKLINQLESQLKLNNINNLPEKSLNEIKCFPTYMKLYECIRKKGDNEDNNKVCNLKKNIKTFFLSHPKINHNGSSLNSNICHNIKDILHKNLFKFRNTEKPSDYNLHRFTSISISDTRMQIRNIMKKNKL